MGCAGQLGVGRRYRLPDADHPGRLPGADRPGLPDAGCVVRPGRHGHRDAVRRRDVVHDRRLPGAVRGPRRCACPAAGQRGCCPGVGRPDAGRAGRRRDVGHRWSACPAARRTGCCPGVGQQLALARALDPASGRRGSAWTGTGPQALPEPGLPARTEPHRPASGQAWVRCPAWVLHRRASALWPTSGSPGPWVLPGGQQPA